MSFKQHRAKPSAKGPADEKILSRVREAVPGGPSTTLRAAPSLSRGGRIACAAAFALAEKLKLSRAQMGQALDALDIKIERCQLGCF